MQVVWDDGENTCGNPCPVVDRDTGTIWLLLTHNLGRDTEKQGVVETGPGMGTSEAPMRNQMKAWAQYMTAEK